jgi:predicted DNA-binding transcriptional regulator AlpA
MKRLADVVRWLEQAPPDTQLSARAVLGLIREAVPSADVDNAPSEPPTATWRERLWTAPAETRLGMEELSEAIGRPKSWIYKRTSQKGEFEHIPHRRLDGVLMFLVGEVRQWLTQHEHTVVALQSIVVPITRGVQRRAPGPTGD